MAASFQLTGEVVILGADVSRAVNDIQKGFSSLKVPIGLKLDARSVAKVDSFGGSIGKLSANLNALTKSATDASVAMAKFSASWNAVASVQQKNINVALKTNDAMSKTTQTLRKSTKAAQSFGDSAALALRRYSAFVIGSKVLFGFVSSLNTAIKGAINFERQMASVSQVTGVSMGNLRGLTDEIKRLSVTYGVASEDLLGVARTLSQAGLSARETKVALDALAKTTLAATFTDINATTEGSIAIMSQFGIGVNQLESALGSVNKVAGKFAVESDDIIAAVRRTGGVFKMASNAADSGEESFRKFIATFTAIRATTRESAESIATGLRTITTRIQRYRTIDFLKQFNINLEDNGKFVGMYEALDRLGEGLKNILKTGNDLRMIRIAEELGGYRQIGKLLPLLAETQKRQEALKVAQEGTNSLTEDQAVAMKTLSVQLQQVREDFKNLIIEIVNTSAFKSIVSVIKSMSHSLIGLARSIEPLIPLITLVGGLKLMKGSIGFAKDFSGRLRGYDTGGPTKGGLALLHDREYVIKPRSAIRLGKGNLDYMNLTGKIPKFQKGGEYRIGGATTTPMISIAKEFDIFSRNLHESNLRLANEINNGTFKKPMSEKIKGAIASPLLYMLAAPMAAEFIGNKTPGRAAAGSAIQGGVLGGFLGGSTAGPWGAVAGATIGAATSARGAYVDKQYEQANKALEESAKKLTKAFDELGSSVDSRSKLAAAMKDVSEKSFATAGIRATQMTTGLLGLTTGGMSVGERVRTAAEEKTGFTATMAKTIWGKGGVNETGMKFLLGNTLGGGISGGLSKGTNYAFPDYDKDVQTNLKAVRKELVQGVRMDNEESFKIAGSILEQNAKGKGSLGEFFAGGKNADVKRALAVSMGDEGKVYQLMQTKDKAKQDKIVDKIFAGKDVQKYIQTIDKMKDLENAFIAATKSIRFFSDEFEKAGDRASYISDTFGEIPRQQSAWLTNRAGGDYLSMGELPNMNVFKNLSGAAMSDIQGVLGGMPVSQTMKDSVIASKVIGANLPDILSEALSQDLAAGKVRSPEIVRKRLLEDPRVGGLDPQILDKVLKPIDDFFGANDAKGGTDFGKIDTLTKEIQSGLDASVKASSDIYDAMYSIRSEFLKSWESIQRMRTGMVMEEAKSGRSFAELENKRYQLFTGKQLTLGQGYAPFNTEANKLLSTGMGGNVNVAHGAGSVQMAAGRMAQLDKQAMDLRQRIAVGGDVGGSTQKLAQVEGQQQALNEYLKLMRDDTSKLVTIENQMLQLESRRESAKSGLQALATSSPLERMKMIQQLTPLLKFQATGEMPTNMRGMQNMFGGLDIMKNFMAPEQWDEWRTKALGGFVDSTGFRTNNPNSPIALGTTQRGGTQAEQILQSEWQAAISGMKAAAEALRSIQANTIRLTADTVIFQYNAQADAINKEIPKFGAVQEAQRTVAVHEVQMKGNMEIKVHGMEFVQELEPTIRKIAANMINQALNQHIDFNTGETKGGKPDIRLLS